jgi:hypothetical protein
MSSITKQTREMLAKMAGNNMQLIRWLESIGDVSASIPGDIAALEAQIAEIGIDILQIEASLDDIEEQVSTLEQQVVIMQAEIDALAVVECGDATIDFGSFPGSNEASVAIVDPTAASGWRVKAYIMGGDTTADHTAVDHRYVGLFLTLTVSVTPSVGMTIYATSPHALEGTFKVRYERVN